MPAIEIKPRPMPDIIASLIGYPAKQRSVKQRMLETAARLRTRQM